MNLPIKLTTMRLLVAPLFAVFVFIDNTLLSSSLCMACVALAIYSDIMDGHIARSRNQITITGKLLDPIADVAFYITAFSALFFQNWIPSFVLFILTIRELSVNIIIRPMISYLSLNPQAKIFGKIKTVLQAILLIAILIARAALDYVHIPYAYNMIHIISYILALVSLLSAIPYIRILNSAKKKG